MATAQATTDHDEIRNWAEARGGHPARVKATGSRKDPGILRIDFPGYSGEDTLEEIEWDEFFEWFDRDNLALLLSDEKGSRFNKLVSRSSTKKSSKSSRSSKSSKSSSSSKSSKKATTTKRTTRTATKKASSRKAPASRRKPSAKK